MTAEEVLNNYNCLYRYRDEATYNYSAIIKAMKEYAHLMCEKQKEICADNAEADYNWVGKDEEFNYVPTDIEVYVLKQSIIQCKNATEI